MLQLIPIVLLIVILACAFGFMVRRDAAKRAREKRRNQYHDRV